jgi:hypothetical protein
VIKNSPLVITQIKIMGIFLGNSKAHNTFDQGRIDRRGRNEFQGRLRGELDLELRIDDLTPFKFPWTDIPSIRDIFQDVSRTVRETIRVTGLRRDRTSYTQCGV